jgi:hypothetical protein
MPHIRHQQANHAGTAARQTARLLVDHVPQPDHGVDHALALVRRDVLVVVNHTRHGGIGNPRRLGYVLDRYVLASVA